MSDNLLLNTDVYKFFHGKMLPSDTEHVYSYFESRPGAKYKKTHFFGLQMLLKRYGLIGGHVITKDKIEEADEFCRGCTGYPLPNREMWEHIATNLNGRLPIKIMAVPEGTAVDVSNVLMTVENTDSKCAALTNYLETILSHVWYPSTVCTVSGYIKDIFKYYDCDPESLPYMLHCFGYRGVSSMESAGFGNCAHLVHFDGTDTIEGVLFAKKYYGWDKFGASVPASEHSVMTGLGPDGENAIISKLLKDFPNGILSVVSDSYDIQKLLDKYCTIFKEAILSRNGKFVIRPDSLRFKEDTPAKQILYIVNKLADTFGYTTNSDGQTKLNPKVGVIYGDGLDAIDIKLCVQELVYHGFASDTCIYGMGGGLLQKLNRDTQRFAFKCSAQYRNGRWEDVYKQPLDNTKVSKKGRLKLIHNPVDEYMTVPEHTPGTNQLVTVFENGDLVKDYTFDEIRTNSNA